MQVWKRIRESGRVVTGGHLGVQQPENTKVIQKRTDDDNDFQANCVVTFSNSLILYRHFLLGTSKNSY